MIKCTRNILLAVLGFYTLFGEAAAIPISSVSPSICLPGYEVELILPSHSPSNQFLSVIAINSNRKVLLADSIGGYWTANGTGAVVTNQYFANGMPASSSPSIAMSDATVMNNNLDILANSFYVAPTGSVSHAAFFSAQSGLTTDLHLNSANPVFGQFESSFAVDLSRSGDRVINLSNQGIGAAPPIAMFIDRFDQEYVIDSSNVQWGYNTYARATNERGQVVGSMYIAVPFADYVNFTWDATSGITLMPPPCPTCSSGGTIGAITIDNRGGIYGQTFDSSSGQFKAFHATPYGTYRLFPLPIGHSLRLGNNNGFMIGDGPLDGIVAIGPAVHFLSQITTGLPNVASYYPISIGDDNRILATAHLTNGTFKNVVLKYNQCS